jgi:hypothetical protein
MGPFEVIIAIAAIVIAGALAIGVLVGIVVAVLWLRRNGRNGGH